MPTLREIVTTNHVWAEARTDSEIAQHIATKPLDQVDGAIRNLNDAYRITAGFNNEAYTGEPINPVGELLNMAYEAEQRRRPPLTPREIEPVVTWIRANPSPLTSKKD